MTERKSNLTGSFKTTQIIIFISLLTSIIAILYSLLTYNKESAARDESNKKNIQYQKELEAKIEELKRMDAEVRELKSMEKFTATGRVARTIAHEVRNPLTNISLAAEQLQDMAIQNSESSMLLDMISRNGIRINQLISDLLTATKAIELNIQKAFLNIMVNAIEAMEKHKGVLTLRTKNSGDQCIIEIEDNGAGMDEDTLQKLFEPYFTNKSKGNGLGLTNCQNIIMSHRGKVSVQSSPGKGSLFVVTLRIDE
jgi:signal transduction histidine kinase